MIVDRRKAWLAWSSGKDCAWALHMAREMVDIDIVGLLTTVTDEYARVSMHGVREELLLAQAESIGLPLHIVRIPSPCPIEAYDDLMRQALAVARSQGVGDVVFGDLFLEDVRSYRESRLREASMSAHFPLWQIDTGRLARQMLAGGMKVIVTCVDTRKLDGKMAGRAWDESFLASLPATVDPCGESGEFHTFVWDGPMFTQPIEVETGEVVEREGFVFCDVMPVKVAGGPLRPSIAL